MNECRSENKMIGTEKVNDLVSTRLQHVYRAQQCHSTLNMQIIPLLGANNHYAEIKECSVILMLNATFQIHKFLFDPTKRITLFEPATYEAKMCRLNFIVLVRKIR